VTGKEKNRVCLGAFAGAHGVKGEARIKTFTDEPKNVAAYGPVETEDRAQKFTLTVIRTIKAGFVLVRAPEIMTREAAHALKGMRLYVDRDKLPEPSEDEYYLEDLVGLNAVDEHGASLGRVSSVHNFGAGDLVEVKDIPGVKGAKFVAFTKESVPDVDIASQTITIKREAVHFDADTKFPLTDDSNA